MSARKSTQTPAASGHAAELWQPRNSGRRLEAVSAVAQLGSASLTGASTPNLALVLSVIVEEDSGCQAEFRIRRRSSAPVLSHKPPITSAGAQISRPQAQMVCPRPEPRVDLPGMVL